MTDLALPDVTLVAVTSVALAATLRAMQVSRQGVRFGDSLLLTHRLPEDAGSIRWQKIDPILSRAEYSRFVLQELHLHIETSHILCIQWDGYVLRPESWDPLFLEYDYIGAIWPQFEFDQVGNGGFSLRSKRLLSLTADLGIQGELEDVAICRTHRRRLEQQFGIRFAPKDVAARFAWERTKSSGHEFGFHGVFNMVKHAPRDESAEVISGLDAGILNMREHRELLRWALFRGRLKLACAIWRRMSRRMARA